MAGYQVTSPCKVPEYFLNYVLMKNEQVALFFDRPHLVGYTTTNRPANDKDCCTT